MKCFFGLFAAYPLLNKYCTLNWDSNCMFKNKAKLINLCLMLYVWKSHKNLSIGMTALLNHIITDWLIPPTAEEKAWDGRKKKDLRGVQHLDNARHPLSHRRTALFNTDEECSWIIMNIHKGLYLVFQVLQLVFQVLHSSSSSSGSNNEILQANYS